MVTFNQTLANKMICGDEVSNFKMQTTRYTAVDGEMNKPRGGPAIFRKFQAS